VEAERLYRHHQREVYGALRGLGYRDAEDLAQTTFLNAYLALRRGNRPESPRPWLMAIARNAGNRRFRVLSRRPQEVELDPELPEVIDEDLPTARELKEALGRLTLNQRTALVLREIEGLSYAEIADRLGLSHSAVETLLFRARRALRIELEGEEERSRPRKRGGLGGLVLWPWHWAQTGSVDVLDAALPLRAAALLAAAAVGVVAGTELHSPPAATSTSPPISSHGSRALHAPAVAPPLARRDTRTSVRAPAPQPPAKPGQAAPTPGSAASPSPAPGPPGSSSSAPVDPIVPSLPVDASGPVTSSVPQVDASVEAPAPPPLPGVTAPTVTAPTVTAPAVTVPTVTVPTVTVPTVTVPPPPSSPADPGNALPPPPELP
jgi:RNA polymerase sigma factor (sigma-70 family)